MTESQRARFIPFNIDKVQYYIDKMTGNRITESNFIEITTANYEKDKQKGYRDRIAGYYDKWYRYNRLDDGKAYDEGCKLAVDTVDNLPEIQIIPCIN